MNALTKLAAKKYLTEALARSGHAKAMNRQSEYRGSTTHMAREGRESGFPGRGSEYRKSTSEQPSDGSEAKAVSKGSEYRKSTSPLPRKGEQASIPSRGAEYQQTTHPLARKGSPTSMPGRGAEYRKSTTPVGPEGKKGSFKDSNPLPDPPSLSAGKLMKKEAAESLGHGYAGSTLHLVRKNEHASTARGPLPVPASISSPKRQGGGLADNMKGGAVPGSTGPRSTIPAAAGARGQDGQEITRKIGYGQPSQTGAEPGRAEYFSSLFGRKE